MKKDNLRFLALLSLFFLGLWVYPRALLGNLPKFPMESTGKDGEDSTALPSSTASSFKTKQELSPNYLCKLNPSAIYTPDKKTVHTQVSSKAGKALSPDEIYRKVSPSIIKLEILGLGSGTGIILTANGLALTNYHLLTRKHLVEDLPKNVSAQLKDGRKYTATVIGSLPRMDLALIQMKEAYNLPIAPLAHEDSDSIRFGNTVYAIGFPNGMRWVMTEGQFIELRNYNQLTTNSGLVAEGSSGGALINSSGQVIGITHGCNLSNGEGWHVSIREVKLFINDMKRLKPQYFKDE